MTGNCFLSRSLKAIIPKKTTALLCFVILLNTLPSALSGQEPDSVSARSFLLLADSCRNAENYHCAITNYTLSVGIYEKLGMQKNAAQTYHRMGQVFRLTGDYEKAVESDLNSLKINESLNDMEFTALNLNNIGIDFHRMRNYRKAMEYLNKSMQIRENINDSTGMADCYINIGMVYDEQSSFDTAQVFYQKALDFYKRTSDKDGMAVAYNNIAGIYYFQGNIDKVLEYALLSLEIRRELNNKTDISFNLINIGMVYNAKGDYPTAIRYIEEGLMLAKEVQAKPQISYGYQSLSDIYSKQGDFRKAYEYHRNFSAINDTIFREKSAEAMAEMQTRYETEKKEQENEILKKDVQIQSNLKKYLLAIASALILLLITLFYLFRLKSTSLKQSRTLLEQEKEINQLESERNEAEKKLLEDRIFAEQQLNRLQKEKYEAELKHKNQELANSALCIVTKNEVLAEIKQMVQDVSYQPGNDEKYPELIRLINKNIDADQNWQRFRIKFEEVHPGFFSRLNEKYPDLSDVYIKLCAYIRINLTTNEIARLISVTLAAVKKNRQRLRKKFNIETDESLYEFIKEI